MGPFQTRRQGNAYIFTATDYYTKWVEAFPIPNKTALEVSRCLQKILFHHGAVSVILTDQGREFVNQVNKMVCEKWNISHWVTAAYHPQTNGLDERTNQTLKSALSKYVNDHQNDWDEYLDEVLFSLRTKPQKTTKYSPFFLLYGREAVYSSQLPTITEFTDEVPCLPSEEDLVELVTRKESETQIVHAKVKENVKTAQERQQKGFSKSNMEKKRRCIPLNVGDRVLKFNCQRAGTKSKGNLKTTYTGPYTIAEVIGQNVKLSIGTGQVLKSLVSMNHVKLFYGENKTGSTTPESVEASSSRKCPDPPKTSTTSGAQKCPDQPKTSTTSVSQKCLYQPKTSANNGAQKCPDPRKTSKTSGAQKCPNQTKTSTTSGARKCPDQPKTATTSGAQKCPDQPKTSTTSEAQKFLNPPKTVNNSQKCPKDLYNKWCSENPQPTKDC